MSYPVWYLPEIGGGILVAIIAVLHVFVSHFAVGGGLYLILAEKKGLREKSQPILDFTQSHARFFLLVTMVFGSITGVGIWFIIALVNPAATSFLIHNFVFGWAAEWVFFTVEIGAAFVYYYMFGRMDSGTHLKVGWLYFFAAWMSLALINGIIGVMLTPGEWAESGDFWQGFFNPSFFPSLFFRTFVALMIAACYGYLSASFQTDNRVRLTMTRFSAKMALAALFATIPAGLWYVAVLPDGAYELLLGKSPTIAATLSWMVSGFLALFALMLVAGIIRPALNLKPVAVLVMLAALIFMGGFEWTREAARRPYVINEVMYSNGIMKQDISAINRDGYISRAVWTQQKQLTDDNLAEVGQELFIQQCYACHTVNGWNNDIVPLTARMSYRALESYLERMHKVRPFMPPFAGTKKERRALAVYITGTLHGKEIEEPQAGVATGPQGGHVFEENCASCHEIGEIREAVEGKSQPDVLQMLLSLNEISEEMEPFDGTVEQRKVLAAFLLEDESSEPVPGLSAIDGQRVFEDHCLMCHGLEDLQKKTSGRNRDEIFTLIGRLSMVQKAMPPFRGTEKERESLADFLDSLKHGGQ